MIGVHPQFSTRTSRFHLLYHLGLRGKLFSRTLPGVADGGPDSGVMVRVSHGIGTLGNASAAVSRGEGVSYHLAGSSISGGPWVYEDPAWLTRDTAFMKMGVHRSITLGKIRVIYQGSIQSLVPPSSGRRFMQAIERHSAGSHWFAGGACLEGLEGSEMILRQR